MSAPWNGGTVERIAGNADGVDVRAVRRWVRHEVERHGAEGVDLADLDLMVDEIAANAWRYSASGNAGGAIRVAVRSAADRVRVEITDDGGATSLPVVKTAAADEWVEGGRGLALVEALADGWGYTVGNDVMQRVTVWFEVARRPCAAVTVAMTEGME